MSKLIRGEFFKLAKLTGYRILLFISIAIGVMEGIFIFAVNSTATGYATFRIFLVWPLFAAIMMGAYTAIFLCSEFTNQTYGISFLCGLPRWSVFLAKILIFFAGIFLLFYINIVLVTVFATVKNGFGAELTAGNIAEILKMFLYSILGYLALGGYFIVLAVLIKNPIGTICIGVGGVYIQMIAVTNLRDSNVPLLKLSFVYQLNQFLDWDSFQDGIFLVVMSVITMLTLGIALFIYVKSDLK